MRQQRAAERGYDEEYHSSTDEGLTLCWSEAPTANPTRGVHSHTSAPSTGVTLNTKLEVRALNLCNQIKNLTITFDQT